MKRFLFALFCMLNIDFTHAATEMTDVYLLAQTKNATELQNIKNIDIVDKNGDTALCSAIKDGNVDVYNLLRNAGANADHKCVKKIPTEQYEHFITKVASANKSWSFLGLGKLAWTAIGVGVAGGAVAVGMGGGGSGGGDSGNTNSYQQNQSCESQGFIYEYSDVCPEGWQIGSSCTNGTTTKYKCNQPASCPYNYTISCPFGYAATENTCKSGDIIYHDCELIQLNCVNGIQNGTQCMCNNGWTGTLCDEPIICPYQTTSCTGMYQETGNTCQSGETLYKECESIQCGAHGIWSEQGCICNEGWTGTLCNVIIACSYDTTSCTGGYEETGNSCQSGETLYKECRHKTCANNASWSESGCSCNEGYIGDGYTSCETNPCLYNTTSCAEGFHETGQTCQFGQTIYKECVANTCNGYNHTSSATCPTGYTIGSSCQSGDTIKYKCDAPATCPYDTTNCTDGYEETGNTCQSGVTRYKECRPKTCPYQTLECPAGYHESGQTCKSGEITYKQCEINTCSYNTTGCTGGYEETGNTCKSGETLYKECRKKTCAGTWTSAGCISVSYNQIQNTNTILIDNVDTGITSETGINGRANYNSTYGYDFYIINSENGLVSIKNTSGTSTGIYGYHGSSYPVNSFYIRNYGTISIDNGGLAEGIHLTAARTSSSVTNQESGNINITNSVGTGISINGYYGNNFQISANNLGTISISNGSMATGVEAINASSVNNSGTINITNSSGVGIKTERLRGNSSNYGIIYIDNTDYYTSNTDILNVYGIQSFANNNRDTRYITNYIQGVITIKSTKQAYGIYAEDSATTMSDSLIIGNMGAIYIDNTNISDTESYGIYAKGNSVKVNNEGSVIIESIDNSYSYGIYSEGAGTINNTGTINIMTNGSAYGIYATGSTEINNSGNISITADENAYGIYATGNSTVINSGTITINGYYCTGDACNGHSNNHIVLEDEATFINSGVLQAPALQLNSMAGKVIAQSGSSFVVDNELSGDLHISNDVVTDGNQTTYIAQNMIDAGDTSGLNLISDSAMFDATLSGKDVVLQMKDFDSLTDNKSLATFFKNNYDAGNSSDLFATLKSMDNISAFNGALSGFTGLNTFTRFAHEDLSALREISLSMNNKLFENSDRDNFDISDSMGYFSFSDNHNSGSGQYGISSSKMSENWKLGYGMAMANIYTNDGDGFSRQNQMWMFYMPATYTNDDIELVITSQAGFTRGQYNRRGFNNQNYEGYIEKQIVGLMNDLRYPITFGNWTLAPDLAFNAIMYKQSGHEDEREFGLIIPNDTMVSVETGLGLYSKYEKAFQDGGRLKFTSGIMGYREYGDTYNIKLGMRGMDGTFDLYNNDYKYRAALNMGVDYAVGNFHMYGNTQYFMDNANYMNFKGGISYRF